jgi:hypothetical protein
MNKDLRTVMNYGHINNKGANLILLLLILSIFKEMGCFWGVGMKKADFSIC